MTGAASQPATGSSLIAGPGIGFYPLHSVPKNRFQPINDGGFGEHLRDNKGVIELAERPGDEKSVRNLMHHCPKECHRVLRNRI